MTGPPQLPHAAPRLRVRDVEVVVPDRPDDGRPGEVAVVVVQPGVDLEVGRGAERVGPRRLEDLGVAGLELEHGAAPLDDGGVEEGPGRHPAEVGLEEVDDVAAGELVGLGLPVVVEAEGAAREEELRGAVAREEQLGQDRAREEEVVVEVEVVLAQPGDVVQPGTDRVRVEAGDRPGAVEQVALVDDGDPRVLGVEPVGELAVGDDVDVPGPGRVLLDRAHRVPQLAVVPEPLGGRRLVHRLQALAHEGLVLPVHPGGVRAVDPHVDDVDREVDLEHAGPGEGAQGPHVLPVGPGRGRDPRGRTHVRRALVAARRPQRPRLLGRPPLDVAAEGPVEHELRGGVGPLGEEDLEVRLGARRPTDPGVRDEVGVAAPPPADRLPLDRGVDGLVPPDLDEAVDEPVPVGVGDPDPGPVARRLGHEEVVDAGVLADLDDEAQVAGVGAGGRHRRVDLGDPQAAGPAVDRELSAAVPGRPRRELSALPAVQDPADRAADPGGRAGEGAAGDRRAVHGGGLGVAGSAGSAGPVARAAPRGPDLRAHHPGPPDVGQEPHRVFLVVLSCS